MAHPGPPPLRIATEDDCLDLVCFLVQVVCMCEEYNSVLFLQTPTEANKYR